MEDYYEYLDSNGVTTLYKLIKDDTVALVDSYSVTINGITTTLDTHINDSDIHTPISDIESMVDTKISGLVNSAPETLDTLKELSDALGNDPNFATTVANQIGNKANKDSVYTKEETNTLLEDKANSKHNHVVKDITDFPTIPTKVSELSNDSNFVTSTELHDYATKNDLNSKQDALSEEQLSNIDSIPDKVNKSDLSTVATSGSYKDLSDKPVIPEGADLSDYYNKGETDNLLNSKANTSDLAVVAKSGNYNDLINTPTIPTKVSDLTNDSGYITGVAWRDITSKPSFSDIAISGSYNDLVDTPNIPTKTSELTNDSGYITSVSWEDVTSKPELSQVAISGSYSDLSGTPTIPTMTSQLINDSGFLTSSSGLITSVSWSDITNKPNFSTVATSGSYNDLSNKPTIPNVYNKTLTIQKNGTNVATFTSNSNTDVTADITVPTKVSELSNDSGFITGISWDKVTNKPTLATVATSGSYTDLSNTPTIPTKTSDLTNDSDFAIDSNVVHKSGNEEISGSKTFTSAPQVTKASGYSIKNTAIARNDVPSKLYHHTFRVYDKNDKILGEYCVEKSTTGCTLLNMNARSEDSNGNQLSESLYLNISNDGSEVRFYPSSNNKVDLGMSNHKWAKIYSDDVVHTSGNETIEGVKTFTASPFVSNYAVTNGYFTKLNTIARNEVPSQFYHSAFRVFDKNSKTLGEYCVEKSISGSSLLHMDVHTEDSEGNDIMESVYLNLSNDGSTVSFHPAKNNRTDLGMPHYKWAKIYSDDVVHTSGNETINGVKSFNDIIKATNGTVQVGADTGYSVTFNYNGNITSKQARGTYNIFLPDANGTLALTSDINGKANDSDVVHKTGNETISGTKMFSNTIHRYADLTTSGGEQVYRFDDTNANGCGHIFNNVHWTGNAVYNRHGAYNNKSGKTAELDIISNDSGVGMIYATGTATKGNLETVTSATGNTALATMGWVNNPETSTNVVHRSGNETIDGIKSFSSAIYLLDNIINKNNQVDLTVTPTTNLYAHYMFVDKNNELCAFMQYGQQNSGTDFIGLFIHDKNRALHGIQITTNNEVIPLHNNTYSLGSSTNKWANVYASEINTKYFTYTHDSVTSYSYLPKTSGTLAIQERTRASAVVENLTLLYDCVGGLDKGDITLNDMYTKYNALVIVYSNDDGGAVSTYYLDCAELDIRREVAGSGTFLLVDGHSYWACTGASTGSKFVHATNNGLRIHKIYGLAKYY